MLKPVYLVDETLLLEIIKNNPDKEIVEFFNKNKALIAISATTWHRLFLMAGQLEDGSFKDFFLDYLQNKLIADFSIIPYDSFSAVIHSDLQNKLGMEKVDVSVMEQLQQASIAISNNLILVTKNKAYKKIQALGNLMLQEF